ncbi:MAG: hypothetical protein HY747_09955, partial [Elusimicrobia bacterium]|nr:hypothetical protein [Elusimicrobiota bacterium]
VISLDPNYGHIHSALASEYMLLGLYEDAVREIQADMERHGQMNHELCASAACYLGLNLYDQAIAGSQQAMNCTPHPALSPLRGARDSGGGLTPSPEFLIMDSCERLIVEKVKRPFKIGSFQMIPCYLICVAHWLQGSFNELVGACQKALEIAPDDSLVSFLLGEAYANLEASPEVIESFKEALEKNNKNIRAAVGLLKIYFKKPDYDLALVYGQKALEITPDDPLVNFQVGFTFWKKGLPYVAVPVLEKAVALDKTNVEAIFTLGEVYAEVNDLASAQSAWQKAVELQGDGEWSQAAKSRLVEQSHLIEKAKNRLGRHMTERS